MNAGSEGSPLVLAGIPVARIQRILAGVVIALFILSSIGRVLKFAVYWDFAYTFVETFWLDAKFGVPRVVATMLLMAVAATAAIVAMVARESGLRASMPWLVLSAMFALASTEKIIGIHDRYGDHVFEIVESEGALTIGASIAVVVLLLGAAVWLGRFVFRLPRSVRSRIGLACAIFVVASIGLEWLGSEVKDVHDKPAIIRYFICASLEETLEMIGTLVFLDAFLKALAEQLTSSAQPLR